MLKLAGFADEVSPDLSTQIDVFRRLGISHLELRGVDGKNVLDFDDRLRTRVRDQLRSAGLGVACIGSPVGKVKISDPWDAHWERFKIAVESAEFFDAPLIRVFSYYPPPGGNIADYREEVLRRFAEKVAYLGDRPVTLVHENERDIFGQGVDNCVALMRGIDSPKLRSAFDFANFVQAGEDPLRNWAKLKPYTVHIHIKDATADGSVVPAGAGVGHLPEILADAYAGGYRGFLSLEPHLAAAGRFSGFSGPDLFTKATEALRDVCRAVNLPLAGGG